MSLKEVLNPSENKVEAKNIAEKLYKDNRPEDLQEILKEVKVHLVKLMENSVNEIRNI